MTVLYLATHSFGIALCSDFLARNIMLINGQLIYFKMQLILWRKDEGKTRLSVATKCSIIQGQRLEENQIVI